MIKVTLQKNSFPLKDIDRILKSFLHEKFTVSKTRKVENQWYFKLPYIGRYSTYTQFKVNKIVEKLCKDVSIKLVFSPFKIGKMFSLKDAYNDALKSNVVYKFSCAGCNACYVGETTRHFTTRIKEHLHTDKSSHVYKHLRQSKNCLEKCDEACFSILDNANSEYQLKIKEALHISWEKPTLNKQVVSYKITIF